jgi:hypothetical protein
MDPGPGCAGFVLGGQWAPGLALGGLVAGRSPRWAPGAIARGTAGARMRRWGGLYLTALAAGVALISWRGSAAELTQLLFGSVLGVDDAALLMMAGAASATLLFLAVAWRPWCSNASTLALPAPWACGAASGTSGCWRWWWSTSWAHSRPWAA